MSHQHLSPGSTAKGMTLTDLVKFGVNVETLGADKDVGVEDPPIQLIDPAGARNVDLPDVTASDLEDDGIMFMIINRADAAEAITVRDAANSDSTVDTVNQNGLGIFFWDEAGGQWLGVAVAA